MIKYFAVHDFAGYRDGQQVTDPAVIAAHYPADLIKVTTTGTGGGGTSTGGTGTAGGGSGGTTTPPASGVFLSSITLQGDGSYLVTDTAGDTSVLPAAGLTPAQSAKVDTLAGLLDSSGRFAADVSAATVGGVTESSIAGSVASHGSSLTAIGLALTSHGNSLSALGTSSGAASTAIGALNSTVGTLTTQVAQAKPITGSSVVGTNAGGTLTYALTSTAAGTTTTLTTLGIPPGMLGAGSVRTNTSAPAHGALDRTLSAMASDIIRVADLGADGSGRTAQQALGVTSRAALAAWTNSSGNAIYAWAAGHPFSSGDDYRFYSPAAVVASSSTSVTFALTRSGTTTGAAYKGPEGLWYVPVGSTNNASAFRVGEVFTAGSGSTGTATGTLIEGVSGSTLQISAQGSTFALANGTAYTVGADLTKFAVGKNLFTVQGLSPLVSITAVNTAAGTITITGLAGAAPLVSGTAAGAGTNYNGVLFLQPMLVYTPLAESTLTQNINMSTLAWDAAYYYGAGRTIYADDLPGEAAFQMSPHLIWAGYAPNIVCNGARKVGFAGYKASPIITYFAPPDQNSRPVWRNLAFYGVNGAADTYIDADFGAYQQFLANNTPAGLYFENLFGNEGSASLCICRNGGDLWWIAPEFFGPGYQVAGSRAIELRDCILSHITKPNIHNVADAFLLKSYNEHPVIEHASLDNVGSYINGSKVSTLNGTGILLFTSIGGNLNCHNFLVDLRSASGAVISDVTVGPFVGSNADLITLRGSNGCSVANVFGGCGGSGNNLVRLTGAVVDSGPGAGYPTVNCGMDAVRVGGGVVTAGILDAGTQQNDLNGVVWSTGTGSTNGRAKTPFIDNSGGLNRINGVG